MERERDVTIDGEPSQVYSDWVRANTDADEGGTSNVELESFIEFNREYYTNEEIDALHKWMREVSNDDFRARYRREEERQFEAGVGEGFNEVADRIRQEKEGACAPFDLATLHMIRDIAQSIVDRIEAELRNSQAGLFERVPMDLSEGELATFKRILKGDIVSQI
jgi:hypothetical protein